MRAKCIENEHGNTNFVKGKIYDMAKTGIRTEWGGTWIHFEDWNKPKTFDAGFIFDFAMCKFEICG